MKIRKYKEDIYFDFDERADIFTPISKYPYYKEWRKIIKHLKSRGFEVKTPKYLEHNNYGKDNCKVCFKGGVVFCLELMCNAQIKLEFGHLINLWKDWEFHFWKQYDDRSIKVSYLDSKRIELEILKVISIFKSAEILEKDEDKLTSVEKILTKEKENTHIHGGAKSLEEIKQYLIDRPETYNQKDRDGKMMFGGELKYYYGWGKILKCGIVHHNINNMWWVLTPDGERNNIASFNLFDYSGESKRLQLTKEQKINRLEKELKKFEGLKNYGKCIIINKEIEKLKLGEAVYNVWSLKHNSWWDANNNGYTDDKSKAGIYLESNIVAKQGYYNNGITNKAIKI